MLCFLWIFMKKFSSSLNILFEFPGLLSLWPMLLLLFLCLGCSVTLSSQPHCQSSVTHFHSCSKLGLKSRPDMMWDLDNWGRMARLHNLFFSSQVPAEQIQLHSSFRCCQASQSPPPMETGYIILLLLQGFHIFWLFTPVRNGVPCDLM